MVSNTVIKIRLKPVMQNTGAEKCFHINNFIDEPCLSHLGAGEEEAHSLHADLQETALA